MQLFKILFHIQKQKELQARRPVVQLHTSNRHLYATAVMIFHYAIIDYLITTSLLYTEH